MSELEPFVRVKLSDLINSPLPARPATHHSECYRSHPECAIAEVERLRAALSAAQEVAEGGKDWGPR